MEAARAPGPRQPGRGHRRRRRRPARALPRGRHPLVRGARAHPRRRRRRGHGVPGACAGRPPASIAIDRLADFICEIGPSPLDRPPVEVDGRRHRGRGGGRPRRRPAGLRVQDHRRPLRRPRRACSGCCRARIKPDDHLVNSRTGADERLHGLFTLRGKEQVPCSELLAGDIGAVAKLAATATGDTLAPRASRWWSPPIEQPEPVLAVAIAAQHPGRRGQAGHRPAPAAGGGPGPARSSATTRPTRPCCGAWARPTCRSPSRSWPASSASTSTPRTCGSAYRETITGTATAEGRHKKQSGGHGQFGVCRHARRAARPRAAASSSSTRSSAGRSRRSSSRRSQKGVEEAMARGGVLRLPGRRRAGRPDSTASTTPSTPRR